MGCVVFFYYRIRLLEKSFDLVNHTIDVKLKLEQTLSNLRDGETEQRGFLITKDSFFLEHYSEAKNKAFEKLDALKELTKDNLQQHNNAAQLHQLVTKRFDALEKVIIDTAFNSLSIEEKRELLMNGKNIMDMVREHVATMKDYENKLLEERQEKKDETVEMTPIYVMGIMVFSVIVLILCYIAMQRYRMRAINPF